MRSVVVVCVWLVAAALLYGVEPGEARYPVVPFADPANEEILLTHVITEAKEAGQENQVWAIAAGEENGLFLLQEKKWVRVQIPDFPEGLFPEAMALEPNGSMVCLWKKDVEKARHYLVRHSKEKHEIHFSAWGGIRDPVITAGSDGRFIITGSSYVAVYTLYEQMEPDVHPIAEMAFLEFPSHPRGIRYDKICPIRVTEDDSGAFVLWSRSMWARDQGRRLNMHPVFKEENKGGFRQVPFDLEDHPITLMQRWRDGRMMLAASGSGLYEIRENEGKRKFTLFRSRGFKYVERCFQAGGSWYFICTPPPPYLPIGGHRELRSRSNVLKRIRHDPAMETSTLYRIDGNNTFRITRKLDDAPTFSWFDRPFLEAENGFWICASVGKIAFVAFGEAEGDLWYLSPENGLPFPSTDFITPLNDSEFLALDSTVGKAFRVPIEPPQEALRVHRASFAAMGSMLIDDGEGRIFGWGPEQEVFLKWDSDEWVEIELPTAVKRIGNGEFGVDGHRQGWLMGSAGGAAVYDFPSGSWAVFESFQKALEEKLKPGDRIRAGDYYGHFPVSSNSDRPKIAYVKLDGKGGYFDGAEWKELHLSKIAGYEAQLSSPPFFRAGGDGEEKLVLPIAGAEWHLGGDGKWTRGSSVNEEYESRFVLNQKELPPNTNAESVIGAAIKSTVCDRNGVSWIIDSKGLLWKALPGLLVPAFSDEEESPLSEKTVLYDVVVSSDGDAFLRLDSGNGAGQHLILRSRSRPPEVSIKVEIAVNGAAILKFGEAPYHQWRIGDGSWSEVTDQKEIRIEKLSRGTYEIEARAWNEDLIGSQAAKAIFEIEGIGDDQIRALIRELGTEDLSSREKAVEELIRQGPAILEKLKAAEKSADDSMQWWIKAVQQQIEQKATRAKQ